MFIIVNKLKNYVLVRIVKTEGSYYEVWWTLYYLNMI